MFVIRAKKFLSDLASTGIEFNHIIKRRRRRYIMAYHRVVPQERVEEECIHDSMWISPGTFRAQIAWMQEVGKIVSIEKILDWDFDSSEPLFALTFDDGWWDNYQYAFPIMKEYGVTATIFIVTAAMNSGNMFWPDEIVAKTGKAFSQGKKVAALQYMVRIMRKKGSKVDINEFVEWLKEFPSVRRDEVIREYYASVEIDSTPLGGSILTWDQVREMNQYGIEIGSHTHTHAIFQYSNDEEKLQELTVSREIICDMLGKKAYFFCYPNARYKSTDGDLVKAAGYRYAFRLHNRYVSSDDDPYLVPRVLVNEAVSSNLNYFRTKLICLPGGLE